MCKLFFFSFSFLTGVWYVRSFQSAEVDHNGTLMAAYLLLSLISLFPFSLSLSFQSVSGLTYPRDVSQDVAIAPLPPPLISPGVASTPTTSVNATQKRKGNQNEFRIFIIFLLSRC